MKNVKLLFLLLINYHSIVFAQQLNDIKVDESGKVSWILPPNEMSAKYNILSSGFFGLAAFTLLFYKKRQPLIHYPVLPLKYSNAFSSMMLILIGGAISQSREYDKGNFGSKVIKDPKELNRFIAILRNKYGDEDTNVTRNDRKI